MPRLLVAAALGLVTCAAASGQCPPWYPTYPVRPIYVPGYPLTPAIWGAPAPKPLPPAPVPFVPKGAAVREEDDLPPPRPADKPKDGTKAKIPEEKENDAPRIPKIKLPLPPAPIDTDPPAIKPPTERTSPKTDGAETKEPAGDGRQTVEQYFVPADTGRGEAKPEVKVGFFNHSDREIQLEVNGEAVRLPKEQYVTLRLPRTFKWAEKGQKGTEVVVPPNADGLEIVFRK